MSPQSDLSTGPLSAPDPSITYWSRLESRPRTDSLVAGLSAQIRDPLWLLGRQWQWGEFQGEDAASLACAQMTAQITPLIGWSIENSSDQTFDLKTPLEILIEGEPLVPNWALRVELGQTLEFLLAQEAGGAELISILRARYLLKEVSEEELAQLQDQELARFMRVCGGRAIDGLEVYLHIQDILETIGNARHLDALNRFSDWVADVYGEISTSDPPAWQATELAYKAEVIAQLPGRKKTVLSASPGLDGVFDWHSFDLRKTVQVPKTGNKHSGKHIRKSLLPSNVSFRGMPNARWWQLEDGTTNFGEIQLDKRDLARLVLLDFMFVHSNNWFVIPIDLAIGSLFSLDSLVLYDVFGGTTLVERADTESSTPDNPWTMFSTALEGQPTCFADFFLLPPSASIALQTGETIEEVHFMRDETANMVWAIEHTTEDGIGQPWSGHERAMEAFNVHATQSTKPDETTQVTSYKIQSNIPENWIPFLPVVIRKRKSGKQIVLERSTILADAQGLGTKYVDPKGRILQPQANPYHLREEEVPRTGLRVLRSHYRTRWIDGSSHVWIGRCKVPGMGEGSSGLYFDALVTKSMTKKE